MRNTTKSRPGVLPAKPAGKGHRVAMYCAVAAVALAVLAGNIQFAPGIFANAMADDKDVLITEDRSSAPAPTQEPDTNAAEPTAQPAETAETDPSGEMQQDKLAASEGQPAGGPMAGGAAQVDSDQAATSDKSLSEIGSPLPEKKQKIPAPEGYGDLIAAMQPDAHGAVGSKAEALAIAKQEIARYYGEDISKIDWHTPEKLDHGPTMGLVWDVTGEHYLNEKDILIYRFRVSAQTGAILNIGVMRDFGTSPKRTEVAAAGEQNARWTQATVSYLNEHGLIDGQKIANTMLEPRTTLADGEYYARLWVILGNGVMTSVSLYDDGGEIEIADVGYSPVWENPA